MMFVCLSLLYHDDHLYDCYKNYIALQVISEHEINEVVDFNKILCAEMYWFFCCFKVRRFLIGIQTKRITLIFPPHTS